MPEFDVAEVFTKADAITIYLDHSPWAIFKDLDAANQLQSWMVILTLLKNCRSQWGRSKTERRKFEGPG